MSLDESPTLFSRKIERRSQFYVLDDGDRALLASYYETIKGRADAALEANIEAVKQIPHDHETLTKFGPQIVQASSDHFNQVARCRFDEDYVASLLSLVEIQAMSGFGIGGQGTSVPTVADLYWRAIGARHWFFRRRLSAVPPMRLRRCSTSTLPTPPRCTTAVSKNTFSKGPTAWFSRARNSWAPSTASGRRWWERPRPSSMPPARRRRWRGERPAKPMPRCSPGPKRRPRSPISRDPRRRSVNRSGSLATRPIAAARPRATRFGLRSAPSSPSARCSI